jgi:predicted small lipoprotein YifL
MLKVLKILFIAHALIGGAAVFSGCGQKGPLFLPTTPDAAGRATLPESLNPWHAKPAASEPVSTAPSLPGTTAPSGVR